MTRYSTRDAARPDSEPRTIEAGEPLEAARRFANLEYDSDPGAEDYCIIVTDPSTGRRYEVDVYVDVEVTFHASLIRELPREVKP